jgi:hypothetical protein
MGEGRVGVEVKTNILEFACYPLPFIPSHQGRGESLLNKLW